MVIPSPSRPRLPYSNSGNARFRSRSDPHSHAHNTSSGPHFHPTTNTSHASTHIHCGAITDARADCATHVDPGSYSHEPELYAWNLPICSLIARR